MDKLKAKLKGYYNYFSPDKTEQEKLESSRWTTEIFRSARLKLTGFYLLILIVFSLVLTLSFMSLARFTFDHADQDDRGVVRQLINNYYSVPVQPNFFNNYQTKQSENVHHELIEDVIMINFFALVVGGLLSYWYAGKALKPIEQAHDAQARFAADASHELRTPLAALRLENEVFLHQKISSLAESKELIRSNLEEAQRLENLANNLLTLTQYNSVRLSLKPVKLSSIINQVSENVAKAARDKHIVLSVDIATRALVVGHQESLVQLVTIIIDNAIKYSPAKTTIYLHSVRDGDNYHLSVRDEGPGISEEDLPFVFDRLYRGDKSRSAKVAGYGLGLSLAKEIARANKASIIVRNYPQGGAQFVVSLVAAKSQ
jgi:two-component system, OmpR family, sensor histidine kinase CiaH